MLKEIISLTIAAALTMLTAGGCKGPNQAPTESKTAGQAGGSITYLTSSTAVQLKNYQNVFAQFTKDTGIKVNMIAVSYDQLYPKLQSLLAADDGPDLNSFGTEFVPWAARGAMTPLDDYVSKDQFDLTRFNQNMVDSVKWNGKLWEIPLSMNTCVLFYNEDLFKKAGITPPPTDWNDKSWTTDAFLKTAQQLTLDKNGKNALDPSFDKDNIVQYGVGGMQTWWFAPWYFGGDWTNKDATKYTGSQDGAVQGLQFEADLTNKYHVMPSNQQTQALAAGGSTFLTGKVAMNIDGTWGCTSLANASFSWNMAATPIGTQHSTVLYTDGFGVGAKCKNPDGGWEFVKWLFSNDVDYQNYLNASSAYMTSPSLTADQDVFKNILKDVYAGKNLDVMFNAASLSDAQPVYMRYNANWNQVNDLIGQQVVTPVMDGKKTAKEACAAVESQVNSLLAAPAGNG